MVHTRPLFYSGRHPQDMRLYKQPLVSVLQGRLHKITHSSTWLFSLPLQIVSYLYPRVSSLACICFFNSFCTSWPINNSWFWRRFGRTNYSTNILPNVWKPPRKRKESTMMLSDAKFEKHVYGLEKKLCIQSLETFDPQPVEYDHGTASAAMKDFVDTIMGKCFCVSLLFNKSARIWKP